MPPYLAPLSLTEPSLPEFCEPTNAFLYRFSATFHTCVPTNLAFISSVLGTCSIISWLFAQLPQIYKNHKLKSTSGLSIFFLTEWLLGDLSNLLGSVFTNQASWQVIIASYYVFVDCCLCGQWIWYGLLKHGRPLRPIWGRANTSSGGVGGNGAAVPAAPGMHQVRDGRDTTDGPKIPTIDQKDVPPSPGRNMPNRSNPMDAFRIPNFARSPSARNTEPWQNSTPTGTPSNPNVRRVAAGSSSPIPSPSPKTVLYISLVLAILSNHATTSSAKPISPFAPAPLHSYTPDPNPNTLFQTLTSSSSSSSSPTTPALAGTLLSWLSTLLYLLSRLPQLYQNHKRKSTAGLSPTLFAAAFFGNLFYSSSLLTNPNAWHDYAPGQGRGWVDRQQGSVRRDWVLRATPFFLGAAGVLLMDAAVGVQFWMFGEGDAAARGRLAARDDVVVVFGDGDAGPGAGGGFIGGKKRRFRWRRVTGWMRGWVPAVSVAATPSASRAATPAGTPTTTTTAGGLSRAGSEVGVPVLQQQQQQQQQRSKSIPILHRQGGPGGSDGAALEEARALLGSSGGARYASPRSNYGAVTPS